MREEIVGEDGLLHCSICGEKTESLIVFPFGSAETMQRKIPVSCRCKREEKEKYEEFLNFEEKKSKISQLRQLSLMDEKLREVNFSTYKQTEENAKALKTAVNYVEKFNEICNGKEGKNMKGLLFWGDVGTGKSFTAAAIANELLNRQIPVIMTSFVKINSALMDFSDVADYINRLNAAKLLVIDDLGAERSSEFSLENVFDVIDSRCRAKKPLILTTNLSLSEIKDTDNPRYRRIYDRIIEMCYPVRMTGLSWRKKEAAAGFGIMKGMLEV